ncbi:MAG TPA: hypothetical protein VK190_03495 [Pseudoneobacillus sp.]|nr:hypothetical protein [Pseudoneobacillus sp.]
MRIDMTPPVERDYSKKKKDDVVEKTKDFVPKNVRKQAHREDRHHAKQRLVGYLREYIENEE